MAVVPGMNLVGEGVPELGVTRPPPLTVLVGVRGAGSAGIAVADAAVSEEDRTGPLALEAAVGCACACLLSVGFETVVASRHALATHVHNVISSLWNHSATWRLVFGRRVDRPALPRSPPR